MEQGTLTSILDVCAMICGLLVVILMFIHYYEMVMRKVVGRKHALRGIAMIFLTFGAGLFNVLSAHIKGTITDPNVQSHMYSGLVFLVLLLVQGWLGSAARESLYAKQIHQCIGVLISIVFALALFFIAKSFI